MRVGQLAAMLARLNPDEDIVVVLTPDIIETETGRVERPLTFDIDRITVTVRPDRIRDRDGAYASTELRLCP